MRSRIITVTSSSNEISTDKLGNRVVVRGGVSLPAPTPFYSRLLDKYVKTTCTGFLLPLDICFIGKSSYTTQKDVSHVTTLYSKIQRRGAQRSQLLPLLFLSPTIKSNVAVIIQHKSGRAANITNHTSMKQSKQLVPKFILTRQGISVQFGPYLSHKAV